MKNGNGSILGEGSNMCECRSGFVIALHRVVSNELHDYSLFTYLHTSTLGLSNMSNHLDVEFKGIERHSYIFNVNINIII